MSRYGLFVPQKFATDTVRYLKFLEGRSLREQLASREIKSIKFFAKLGAKARLVGRPGGFEVFLDRRRKRFWPVDLGHEIGHTFFFDLPPDPLKVPERIYSRPYERKDWEEALCDCFGFQWVLAGNNREEAVRLFGKFKGSCWKLSHGDQLAFRRPLGLD